MARGKLGASAELILCTMIWAFSFAVTKGVGREITPILGIFVRIALALPVLAIAAWRRGELSLPTARDIPGLVALAFLGVIIVQDVQYIAMRSAGVANANWIVAAEPVVTALLARIFLGEKFGLVGVLGFITAMIGVLLVVGLGTHGLGLFSVGGMGDVLLMGTAVAWCAFQTVGRALVTSRPPAFTVFWMFAAAFAMQSAILPFSGESFAQLADVSARAWCSLVYLGCISSGACYMMWCDGLAAMPAGAVAAFLFLQPVFGSIAGYLIEGERFTIYAAAGGALVIAGVAIVSFGRKR